LVIKRSIITGVEGLGFKTRRVVSFKNILFTPCSKMVPMQLSSELEEVKAGRKRTDALASDTLLLTIIDL